MDKYQEHYLLDKKVKIFQPNDGYHASIDAVFLAALVNKIKKNQTILDVGSGTGAVSLCLASRFKDQHLSITGVEIQENLAYLANLSAQANNFNFLKYINLDIKQKENPISKICFDHVLTNPPYSLNDMASPNSSKAYAHNFQNMNLKTWIEFCLKRTSPNGHFYIINRAEALPEILHCCFNKIGAIKIIPLTSYEGEKAKRVLVTGQKNNKTPAEIHSPIIVHSTDGNYTTTAQKILRDGASLF